MIKKRTVPASALHFITGPFSIGDNGEGSKSAPFAMVARSGGAIEHPFWGKVVHDLDGMQLKSGRVAIDYCHDQNEVIGYANHFDASSGDLQASGALTPFKDSDRATEILHKSRQGVPYEASINFRGDIKIEDVPEGATASANGREFSGPATIIREWPLRGIAVCPYGADQNTESVFSESDNSIEVEVMANTNEGRTAELEQQPESAVAEAVETPAVESDAVNDSAEADDTAVDAEEAAEAPAQEAATPAVDPRTGNPVRTLSDTRTGQDFLDRFGEQGGVWFAQGKSWDESIELHSKAQSERIADLERQLTATGGELSPVEFSAEVDAPAKEAGGLSGRVRIQGKNYDN